MTVANHGKEKRANNSFHFTQVNIYQCIQWIRTKPRLFQYLLTDLKYINNRAFCEQSR